MPVPNQFIPPRLKGENPPQWAKERSNQFDQQLRNANELDTTYFVAGLVIILAGVLFHFAERESAAPTWVIILTVVAVIAATHTTKSKRDLIQQEMTALSQQLTLNAYNTEFTAPLADRSTLRITVHFQLPSVLAVPAFVEQLNRVTDVKLVVYAQESSAPPSRLQIEEYLNRELAQFQEENNIPVMRVNVPIAIHVHPDKPKAVHV